MSTVINSYNEWDKLEEVILGNELYGTVWGEPVGTMPAWINTFGDEGAEFIKSIDQNLTIGAPLSAKAVAHIQASKANFVKLLEGRNVKIHHADVLEGRMEGMEATGRLPAWNPRDIFLPSGSLMVECQLSSPSRRFEQFAYRAIRNDYIRQGARWVCAPQPVFAPESFNPLGEMYDYEGAKAKAEDTSLSQEDIRAKLWRSPHEPAIEAADVLRAGKDYFVQLSHVTNKLGYQWIKGVLAGEGIRAHIIDFPNEHHPYHIDTSFVCLKPGVAVYDGKRPPDDATTKLFKSNDWRLVPLPESFQNRPHYNFSLNLFSLSPEEAVCDKYIAPFLEDFGVKALQLDYTVGAMLMMGSLHCSTCDVKRQGGLQSYFPSLDKQE